MLEEARFHQQAGRYAHAASLYAKRADAGGNEEEVWYARWQYARCLRDLGDEGGFLRQALTAFHQRPQRAEPLYDLARFYRERGMNDASVLFCEAGLALPHPEPGAPFLEEFVYTTGLREEYSITANYARDPARKDRGYAACNWLALKRDIPSGSRDLARYNLEFYVQPASAMMPSFAARPIGFTPPDGFRPMNPSVVRWGEQIMLVVRSSNYTVSADGRYEAPDGARHLTRNFLLSLNDKLDVLSSAEILPPADLPKPLFDDGSAFGDMRLFVWRDALWCIACYRELTPLGCYEQVLARIDGRPPGPCRLTDWRVLRPEMPQQNEKNWMPRVEPGSTEAGGDRLQFIYLCDPTRIVDDEARTIVETTPTIAADDFKGGSQAVPFGDGWLVLIHEVRQKIREFREGWRDYRHRFVWFDKNDVLRGVSRPFIFNEPGIEFAAGLAWHPDGKRLLVSYGVRDSEAWIAMVEVEEVRQVLENAERLPTGAPVLETFAPAQGTPATTSQTHQPERSFDCVLWGHDAQTAATVACDDTTAAETKTSYNTLTAATQQVSEETAGKTLVIYHYFERDHIYRDNLSYFLRYGILASIDYIICVNGGCSINLPVARNVRYHFRPNVGFDSAPMTT
jgi:hypothetical protein